MLRSSLALAALLAAAVATPAAAATPDPCRVGQLLWQDGALRITALVHSIATEDDADEYACLGSGRAVPVGGTYVDGGTGFADSPRYAWDGSRFLATIAVDGGEGGDDVDADVIDLVQGKRRASAALGIDRFSVAGLRVTAAGSALAFADDGEGFSLFGVVAPGTRFPTSLSTEGARVSDPAAVGATAYWTEQGPGAPSAVRSAAVPGNAGAPEDHPVRIARVLPRPDACFARPGTTLAATQHVRVFVSGGTRLLCRGKRARALTGTGPVRIVGGRWALTRDPGLSRLVDARTGRLVTRAATTDDAPLTVTDTGAVAWLAADGSVRAQRQGDAPFQLAPATDAPSALASGGATVYWTTADGVAHAWHDER